MKPNIGIVGVGGIGGYFGGKLSRLVQYQKANVYFVARGKHLEAIGQNGLLLHTDDEGDILCRPTLATDQAAELPMLDICLVSVKSYDLPAALAQVQNRLSEKSFVLPLLNGADIYERVRNSLSFAIVFPACVYIGTHIEAYGKVTQKGGACTILMGPDPRAPGIVPQMLFDVFSESRIKYQWFSDVIPEVWKKYLFIASFGLVTAAFDKTLGQVMQSPQLTETVRLAMREIEALARKQNIALPDSIVVDSLNKGNQFVFETKTSFQRDVEQSDKPDERDIFSGTIIRLGKALGVDTPVIEQLSQQLKPRSSPLVTI
jgi:2-dehydropantoate 2-reductase